MSQKVKNRGRPERTRGYKSLLDRYGAERLGDALLAKWMSDPDADQSWARLDLDVRGAEAVSTWHPPRWTAAPKLAESSTAVSLDRIAKRRAA